MIDSQLLLYFLPSLSHFPPVFLLQFTHFVFRVLLQPNQALAEFGDIESL